MNKVVTDASVRYDLSWRFFAVGDYTAIVCTVSAMDWYSSNWLKLR